LALVAFRRARILNVLGTNQRANELASNGLHRPTLC
jgi:hypothetical protein